MNRDEAFELQLAQWLEEGPFEAPAEPIAAALAHVRANPMRPAARMALWRRAMSTIGITQVPSQPRRGWVLAGAAAVVALLVVAGGYGLLRLGPSTGPGAPTASPGVTPTPMSTPAALSATGVQTCAPSSGDVTITIDEVEQTRGGVIECTSTSSDPRLAGDATITMDYDEFADGRWLGWGTTEIRNAGGTWSGTYAVTSTATADVMEFDAVLLGTGQYDGLEVRNHVVVSGTGITTISSRIFEAGPAVTGTEQCRTASRGRSVDLGQTTGYREVVVECTDTMSDPRLSGDRTVEFSIDMRADDSADIWGMSTLTNADGTWKSFFFGTVDPGYATHHAQTLLRGTGAYDGLFFRMEIVGDGTDFQLRGEVIPAD